MTHLTNIFLVPAAWMLRVSIEASVLVLVVLAMQQIFQHRLTARWRCALWSMVLIRLILPMDLPSKYSIASAVSLMAQKVKYSFPSAAPKPTAVTTDGKSLQPQWTVSYGPVPVSDPTSPTGELSSTASIGKAGIGEPPRLPPTPTGDLTSKPSLWITAAIFSWCIMSAAILLRLFIASSFVWRKLKTAKPFDDRRILDILAKCRQQAGVKAEILLIETPTVESPALAGVFRPRLLMPPGLALTLSDTELSFVFLHELAHLRRHDLIANWLTNILQSLHWFNPILWLAGARMRADRELACDAMVLTWTGQVQRCDYGQTLLKLMQSIPSHAAATGAVGIAESHNQFARRITMISRFENSPRRSVLGTTLMALLAIVGLTGAAEQDSKPVAKPAPANKIDAVAPTSQPEKLPPLSDEEIHKVLQRTVNLDLANIPFTDAVDFLRDLSGINIVVNRQAFHEVGLDEKKLKVNVKLKNVTLDKALDVLLDEVGSQNKLGYKVDEGLVVLSTAVEIARPRMPFMLNDENLAKSLARNVKSVEFADIPLKDAISFIRESSGENIHVKWEQLEALGISKGQPLNLKISGITFKRLLRLVMENACPAGAAILADRNVITISSAQDVAPMILCELKLISMPREDLAKLWQTLEPSSHAPDGNHQLATLDAKQTEKLLAAVGANKNAEILSAPKVTMYGGQTASISIGSEFAFTTDYKKIVDASGVAAYSPVASTVFKGITIHLRGNVNKNLKAIDLNLKALLTGFKEPVEEVPYPDSPADRKLVIKKVQAENATLETTVNIPTDATAAINGLKSPSWQAKDANTALLILVNASRE